MSQADWPRFAIRPDGSQFPQSSAPEVVARVLVLAAARPGERVLEIGTGSGYSTGALARDVGPSGRVISLDHAPEAIEHATVLLAGVGNVQLVFADGIDGWAAGAPYDLIVAWASLDAVPDGWRWQLAPEGPVTLPVAGERRVVRFRRSADGWVREGAVAATFVPMTHEPLRPWLDDPRC